jgi:tungstate transport system substrate-binding protein
MKRSNLLTGLLVIISILVISGGFTTDAAQNKNIILATTTSTVDTGLLDLLVPDFEKRTGYIVKTIAVGTGQALVMGQKGEADVLLTHAPESEVPLVEKGIVVNYQLVMHNDFVVVGPAGDPAKIKGIKLSADAFKKIAETSAIFISRGDDSGTHKKELSLWKMAGLKPGGSWYQQSGSGMGQTLLIASEKKGYTLTDRGTYLAQQKNLQLEIMVQGEKNLLNIYHVMQVNAKLFPKVNERGARAFVKYMVSRRTQLLIAEFGKEKYGQALFIPDVGKRETDLGK